jgi:prepilin-type N-terminal cleavage/methylation domain-containing protein
MQLRTRTDAAGFTLLEIMVGVALVGILAAIALPTFADSSRKSKQESEVRAFINELRLREAAYMAEKQTYLATAANESATPFPAATQGAPTAVGTLPATWTSLKVRAPAEATCTYMVIAGTSASTPGAIATATFKYHRPGARDWFYVLARCADGTAYFAADDSSTIVKSGDAVVYHEGDVTAAH